jgi:hypothetical protein
MGYAKLASSKICLKRLFIMFTLTDLEKRFLKGPVDSDLVTLKELVKALCVEGKFNLSDLYELPLNDFELAIETLKSWRLDRYTKTKERITELICTPSDKP